MNVYLYNNTKRLNSTKAAPTAVDTLTCVLKDNCSFLNPALRVKATTLPTFNYFKFEDRYYWLTDLISVAADLWEIHGAVDVLTTYRGHIFNTSAFVIYDSTPNTQLPDTRLAIETDVETRTANAVMPWNFRSGNGTYLIATTGDSTTFDFVTNTVTYDTKAGSGVYVIPQSKIKELGFDAQDVVQTLYTELDNFNQEMIVAGSHINAQLPANPSTDDIIKWFAEKLYGQALSTYYSWLHVPTVIYELVKNLIGGGSALENIKACYWLPFEIPSDAMTAVNVPLALGTFTDSITGLYRINKPVITSVIQNVSIPWKFNDWRNASCTEVFLYIPLVGCISIPSEVVKGNSTVDVKIALNLCSGAMAAEVLCDGGQLGTYGANTAMPYLIGDSNISMGNVFNTVVNAAAQNYAGAVASGMTGAVGMATSVGGVGGGAGTGLTDDIVCTCRVHNTSQEPSLLLPVIGTPTYQLKQLSSGLGYAQCQNAQVSGTAVTGEPYATQTELQAINTYLNSGVYLE